MTNFAKIAAVALSLTPAFALANDNDPSSVDLINGIAEYSEPLTQIGFIYYGQEGAASNAAGESISARISSLADGFFAPIKFVVVPAPEGVTDGSIQMVTSSGFQPILSADMITDKALEQAALKEFDAFSEQNDALKERLEKEIECLQGGHFNFETCPVFSKG